MISSTLLAIGYASPWILIGALLYALLLFRS
jgi:hypothetical protein